MKKFLWVWWLWLIGFYAGWLWLVIGLDYWATAVNHWPIALAMTLGSYAAGSTPMGGGTIGFPVLVLLFEMPASLGRDFSFAVQAIGMTSASIFILARRPAPAAGPGRAEGRHRRHPRRRPDRDFPDRAPGS
ncbi:MAG: hypothetical protein U5L08_13585 [Xanthomonadales bacterium]|nr:hypothetical protein [Xanthomonadales bacterium]